ncbi:MAG: autotransporter-associated beta strand repeat-containing protein [Planctomycetia bacterium]|nr:autotransporter-associated beta strand repeat-containing protein [Planctomycetia bacterium]
MFRKDTVLRLVLVGMFLGEMSCAAFAASYSVTTGNTLNVKDFDSTTYNGVSMEGGTLVGENTSFGYSVSFLGGTTSTVTSNNGTFYLEKNITGSGNFTKDGSQQLHFKGDNSGYTGTVTVTTQWLGFYNASSSFSSAHVTLGTSSGGLVFFSPSSEAVYKFGMITGGSSETEIRVTSNDGQHDFTLEVGDSTNGTFAGRIVDKTSYNGTLYKASLIKTGTGTWTLTGSNTYTGTTTISEGTLQIGNGGGSGTLGTGNVAVSSGANLVVNRTGDITLSGALSGAGNFSTVGSGTTTLASPYTITGTTNVGAGTLVFDGSSGSQITGVLSGSGKIVANTDATLAITSTATTSGFTGTLEVQSGTLSVPSNKLGGTTGILISNGTFFTTSGAIAIPISFGSTGTHVLRVDSGSLVLTSALGSGDFTKTGGGQLHFQGDNSSYTGTITVNNVGNSWLGFYNAESSMPNATITFESGSQTRGIVLFPTNNPTYKFGMITGGGSGTEIRATQNGEYGNFTLEVGNSTDGTFAGAITDVSSTRKASLIKTGTGTWTLTGSNTYTGTTTISEGTLQIGNGGTSGSLSNSTAITIANGATLAYNRSDEYQPTIASLTSNGGTIATKGTTLVLSTEISGTGVTFDAGSSMIALQKTLSADDVTLQSGTLRIGYRDVGGQFNATTLTINEGATLEVRNMNNSSAVASSGTIASDISGAGTIRHVNNSKNTLTLSGNNDGFTGTIEIQGGNVILQGAAALGGTSALDLSGGKLTLDGTPTTSSASLNVSNEVEISASGSGNWQFNGGLTGNGTLTKTGDKHLILGGDNSGFSGTINVSQQWIGLSGSTSGSKEATFTMSSTTDTNIFLEVTDSGTVYMGDLNGGRNNGGASIVRPRNTSSQTITLSVGWLGNDSTFASNLMNDNAPKYLAVEKAGSGTWTLTGTANSYTGATTVSDGTLRIDGAITSSAITVKEGAAIAGSGNIGNSLTINEGGALWVDLNTWIDNPATTPLSVNNLTFDEGAVIQFAIDDPMLLHGVSAIDYLDATTLSGLENVIFDFSQAGGNGIWNYGVSPTGELWVELNTAAVPEPGTWALLLLGLGWLLRRGKKNG